MATEACELNEVAEIARPIVERVVWATVTTVSPEGEPRSRLMHPVWWWDGPVPTAVVSARPTPIKVRHLAANSAVSCSYWDPAHDTVTIDAVARWIDAADRHDAWERVKAVPEPVGFDPAMIWKDGPTSPDCAFLHLTARRIVATPAGMTGRRWSAAG
ncbi:MAG: pyridoxamine 5'-phosphate oxidase family protein [Acidimicrobiales bacterium]